MPHALENKKKTLVSDILDCLIDEFGEELNVTRNTFSTSFSERTGISERAAYQWLQGKVSTLRKDSVQALIEFFRPALPSINLTWFDVNNIEEFKERLPLKTGRGYPCFGIPEGKILQKEINDLGELLSGTYILYRHAYHKKGEKIYVRELMHVYYDNNNTLMFKSYYYTDNYIGYFFKGSILPIGDTIIFVGTAWENDQRARALFFEKRKTSLRKKSIDYHIGILTSNNLERNMPCSTRVVLLRDKVHKKRNMDICFRAKSIVRFGDEHLLADFGKNEKVVEKILSNDGEGKMPLNVDLGDYINLMTESEVYENWFPK